MDGGIVCQLWPAAPSSAFQMNPPSSITDLKTIAELMG